METVRRKYSLNSLQISCLVQLLICLPLAMCAPPSYSLVTPSPKYNYPIATISPVERRPQSYGPKKEADFEDYDAPASAYPTVKSSYFAPSSFLLAFLRTILDVLRKVNSKKAKTGITHLEESKRIGENATLIENHSNITRKMLNVTDKGRGMDPGVIYDDYHHQDEPYIPEPMPMMPMTEAPKEMEKIKQSRYQDPWEGYYEFIITEGSFKFWSSFQLATAGLLLYSALAAIYYAKFNPIQPDYDTTYDDYFFGRSLEGDAPMLPPDSATPAPGWLSGITGMGRATFQRIMDAIHMAEDKL